MFYANYDAPFGNIVLAGDSEGLRYLLFESGRQMTRWGGVPSEWIESPAELAGVAQQLDEYFDGTRTEFDLQLAPEGTAFRLRVWNELCRIPFGETTSYGEIAGSIGQPTASRAVGAANGDNPISIVVPCHRVIGSTGNLVGFGGGLSTKEWLLNHERNVLVRCDESQFALVSH